MGAQAESSNATRPTKGVRQWYKRPPVLEAVIDIQVEPRAGTTLDTLRNVYSGEETAYPIREEMAWVESTLTLEGSQSTSAATQTPFGYRIVTQTRDKIIQVRLNGIASSRLQPYSSWEDNLKEAKHFWNKYREAVRPEVITRFAVRYINRIRLPGSAVDLTEYFRVRPELPSEMPHNVNNFVLRMEIPQPDLPRGMLVLNQGMVPDAETGGVAFLLDLDVFQTLRMSADSDELWDRIEKLHERENTLFEQSVTDQTRALFN
jgi:uncharacterized protein (TIGR04255 family)